MSVRPWSAVCLPASLACGSPAVLHSCLVANTGLRILAIPAMLGLEGEHVGRETPTHGERSAASPRYRGPGSPRGVRDVAARTVRRRRIRERGLRGLAARDRLRSNDLATVRRC